MNKKILILYPRLDISFKDLNNGYVPENKDPPNHPIRFHWKRFLKNLEIYHKENNDIVDVLEKPLWQFKQDDFQNTNYDTIYIPHKNNTNFKIPNNVAKYYAQTVFPEYFTIDGEGWGPGMSWIKLTNENVARKIINNKSEEEINIWFEDFKKIYTSKSKFEQPHPQEKFPYKNYMLFTCQLPHDEIIKFYGYNPLDCLKISLDCAKMLNRQMLVKGHPINLDSNYEFKELTKKYNNAVWVDNLNIHDCIKNSDYVITINSGTGFEAILHEKPLICFGMSEYIKVSKYCFPFQSSLEKIIFKNDFETNINQYKNWLHWFMNRCINSNDINSYSKIKEI